MRNIQLVKGFILVGLIWGAIISNDLQAQRVGYWQQEVYYTMKIDMDTKNHRFRGHQVLRYKNNSPDTLTKVYYHLYFNAFQPGSMMDIRSRHIADPDTRVMDRIYQISRNEIGYHRIHRLTQNKKKLSFEVEGTILIAYLANPIPPGGESILEMNFSSQIPLQIRRSGRDNKEGIAYSMTQWYPKICAYDEKGWHPNPYIGREFYGVWGTFDVTINMDKDYIIAASGVLQNPDEVGYGYTEHDIIKKRSKKLSWHFVAEKVHDFFWAADPDYTHRIYPVNNQLNLHFFHQTNPLALNADESKQAELLDNWNQLPDYTIQAFDYMNKHFGMYPYPHYSIVQGGDGGMEYPMGTLITGNRSLKSLIGVTVHELVHSWYQGVLATNEARYAWMDEGFTTYATNRLINDLDNNPKDNPHTSAYRGYQFLIEKGLEEPLSTHADHFNLNMAYGIASYSKGAIFLHQLDYIVGRKIFDQGMKHYFNTWKFSHPTDHDFIRIMEKESDMVLDWYLEYWVYSTKTIDYAIDSVSSDDKKTIIILQRVGDMPMPIEVEVALSNGTVIRYYIPLVMMRGEKTFKEGHQVEQLADWAWVNPSYTFTIKKAKEEIISISIDRHIYMADINLENNIWKNPNVK